MPCPLWPLPWPRPPAVAPSAVSLVPRGLRCLVRHMGLVLHCGPRLPCASPTVDLVCHALVWCGLACCGHPLLSAPALSIVALLAAASSFVALSAAVSSAVALAAAASSVASLWPCPTLSRLPLDSPATLWPPLRPCFYTFTMTKRQKIRRRRRKVND